jgi:hypothetical protein
MPDLFLEARPGNPARPGKGQVQLRADERVNLLHAPVSNQNHGNTIILKAVE